MNSDPVHRVFTYALRAGSTMARNGAPAANVTHTLLAVARTFGYPKATAAVTMDQLTLSRISADEDRTVSLSQSVGASGFNLAAISAVETVTKDVILGDKSIDDGLKTLEAIERSSIGHALIVRLLGWAIMAAGFALLLGADLIGIALTALTALFIEAVGAVLETAEVPVFFSHVVAGVLATGAAVTAIEFTPAESHPALIITAALVSRLAGGAALGAAQDLLTGWYLTAAGRIIEAAVVSIGQIVGVVIGITIASRLGVRLSIDHEPVPTEALHLMLIATVMVAGGFAIASQTPWVRIPLVCLLAVGASLLNTVFLGSGLTAVTSLALATTAIGSVAVIASRLIKIPPSSALGVALAPLLPGMEIYLGFVALTNDDTAMPHFVTAGLLAMALGTGAVLGEYLASQILWHGMKARGMGEKRIHGSTDTDARILTAEWLSTPVFRRPFLVEEFQPADEEENTDAHQEAKQDEREREEGTAA